MSGAAEPPLGRYTPQAQPAEQLYDVQLLGVPVGLYVESRERHDELVREFSLLALADRPVSSELPARFVELVEVLGVRYGGASARPDLSLDQAVREGRETVDLTYQVPSTVVEAAAELERWLVLADEFCASERLLTLPRHPELKRLATWYFDEFRRQVAGEPAQPWTPAA